MAKKVLGISFGRKMSNTEVMIKEALLQCQEAGCEIQFIRADALDIHICTGCISCVVGMISHRGKGGCPLKDDFHILDEAIMEADGIIVGSPIYETSPTGNFKVVCDRLGPSHDITFRKAAYDEGVEMGLPEDKLPDVRSFKKRSGAFITVGGAMTENWLAMGEPLMYEFFLSMGIDVVDKYQYWGAMAHEHVLGNQPVMDRMTEMGKNLAASVLADMEEERTMWRGAQGATCPVCHCNMINILHEGTDVECPICGIKGELSIEDKKIKVNFSEAEQNRSRLRWGGKLEHSTEIKTKSVGPGQIPNLKDLKAKYIGVGEN